MLIIQPLRRSQNASFLLKIRTIFKNEVIYYIHKNQKRNFFLNLIHDQIGNLLNKFGFLFVALSEAFF